MTTTTRGLAKEPIQINGVEWGVMANKVALTMCRRNARGQLSEEIFRIGDQRVHLDNDGVAKVIDRPMMRLLLAEQFDFYMLTAKGDRTDKPPPLEIIEHLLCAYAWNRSNPSDEKELPVQAVYRAPVILPDGTLLDKPGYDAASELVLKLDPTLKMSSIPRSPSFAQAQGALEQLLSWISDFPFEDQASRANAIGFMLTPTLRPLLGAGALVPLFVLDAPTAGSGKGLFIDLVSMIASGTTAAMIIADADDDEQRKRVAMILRGAPTLLHYDNSDKKFGSGAVASMLTTRGASFERVLGSSNSVSQVVRTTFALSGNNVQISGDMPRRVVHIRLNARVEHPAQRRNFKHRELLEDAHHERGQLLVHVLTIGRYVAQHRDEIRVEELPSFGSFEAFNTVIGGALQLLRFRGWLENREEFEEVQSEDIGEWVAFLAAVHTWQAALPRQSWTARELVDEYRRPLKVNPILSTWPLELISRDPHMDERMPKKLGDALNQRRERVFGGYTIKRVGQRHNHVIAWAISASGDAGGIENVVPPTEEPSQSRNGTGGGTGGTKSTPLARKKNSARPAETKNSLRARGAVLVPPVPPEGGIQVQNGDASGGIAEMVPPPSEPKRTRKVKDTTVHDTEIV